MASRGLTIIYTLKILILNRFLIYFSIIPERCISNLNPSLPCLLPTCCVHVTVLEEPLYRSPQGARLGRAPQVQLWTTPLGWYLGEWLFCTTKQIQTASAWVLQSPPVEQTTQQVSLPPCPKPQPIIPVISVNHRDAIGDVGPSRDD